ncbi:DNA topoisomerase [Vibrio navarrensis]|uniref:DNA topoisomerase n=1 Tax=Vibrio navarrensis TaxID=29495 RepID=UPI0018DC5D31|nr:DNA topoisomerase [Vibrio navarrensis]MBH9739944.1 hypothetical protein [Vibrio navarrensis]
MTKAVIIAEKSSQAEKIAHALHLSKRHGYYEGEFDGAYYYLWYASGHLVELVSPDKAIPNFSWEEPKSHENIPRNPGLQICPDIPSKGDRPARRPRERIELLQHLLTDCNLIIGATDPDREGETIYRMILNYLNVELPMKRAWFTKGLSTEAILAAFQQATDASKYAGYYYAGMGRRASDYGSMVLTTNYTYYGRKGMLGMHLGGGSKVESVVSVGRVQTTVLWICCQRYNERLKFSAITHYQLKANVSIGKSSFVANYVPQYDDTHAGVPINGVIWKDPLLVDSENNSGSTDELGANEQCFNRLTPLFVDKAKLNQLGSSIVGTQGNITRNRVRNSLTSPPKPFSQTQLQAHLSGISIADILASCQRLYEAGVISYPRSEESDLAIKDFDRIKLVHLFANLAKIPELANGAIQALDVHSNDSDSTPSFVPSCYKDTEMAHEGLSPTMIPRLDDFTNLDRTIFIEISKRFIQAHLPPAEYVVLEVDVEFPVSGLLNEKKSLFRIRESVCVEPGWKAGFSEETFTENLSLPDTSTLNSASATTYNINESTTSKPPLYSTNTIVMAMYNVYRFEPNIAAREALKRSKGIGTTATRPSIISTLFNRGYIAYTSKKKTTFDITPKGLELLKVVPASFTSPSLTASWEDKLFEIESLSQDAALSAFQSFVDSQLHSIEQLIRYLNAKLLPKVSSFGFNPNAPIHPNTFNLVKKRVKGLGLTPPPNVLTNESAARQWLKSNPWIITEAMWRKIEKIRLELNVPIPSFEPTDFGKAIEFIGAHKDKISASAPSLRTIEYAKSLSESTGLPIPPAALNDSAAMSSYINAAKSTKPPSKKLLLSLKKMATLARVAIDLSNIRTSAQAELMLQKLKDVLKSKSH